jgi:hypothetical protein
VFRAAPFKAKLGVIRPLPQKFGVDSDAEHWPARSQNSARAAVL